jgi:hypothetical protein
VLAGGAPTAGLESSEASFHVRPVGLAERGGIAYNLLAEGEKFLVLSNFGFGGNMKIPEVANRIREIAEQVQGVCPDEANELLELADQLRRRPLAAPRAPATSTPMTDELAQDIRDFAEANPGMSHQEIAVEFNVNHGRVSEAISGKRA